MKDLPVDFFSVCVCHSSSLQTNSLNFLFFCIRQSNLKLGWEYLEVYGRVDGERHPERQQGGEKVARTGVWLRFSGQQRRRRSIFFSCLRSNQFLMCLECWYISNRGGYIFICFLV